MKVLILSILAATGLLSWQVPVVFRLDQEGGINDLYFGKSIGQIAGFEQQFRKHGRPRLRTQLYTRPNDTVQLGGIGTPSDYWFRQGKFIGIDKEFHSLKLFDKTVEQLTKRYGLPQIDVSTKQWYWLGQHSFILLEVSRNGTGSLLIGSLTMLNELVEEVPVRAQARQLLGWQPDSVGLPKQLRLRH